MTNHIHLAIQIGEVSLSRIIQNLAFRYTRYINWKLQRVGHLFQGRFKSVLVNSDCYLKALVRYIHLNPVKAAITARPEDYRWSSHRAYLKTDEYVWLTTEYALYKFGHEVGVAIKQFQEYVLAGIGIDEEIDFEAGCSEGTLGDDDFVKSVRAHREPSSADSTPLLKLDDLLQSAVNMYGVSKESLCAPGKIRELARIRSVLAAVASSSPGITLQDLAVYLRRDVTTMSKAGTLMLQKARHDPKLAVELKQLRNTQKNVARA